MLDDIPDFIRTRIKNSSKEREESMDVMWGVVFTIVILILIGVVWSSTSQ